MFFASICLTHFIASLVPQCSTNYSLTQGLSTAQTSQLGMALNSLAKSFFIIQKSIVSKTNNTMFLPTGTSLAPSSYFTVNKREYQIIILAQFVEDKLR